MKSKTKATKSEIKSKMPQRVVLILGAGASLSSSNKKIGRHNSPPLDANFFKIASHLFSKRGRKNQKNIDAANCWTRFKQQILNAGINSKTITDWSLEGLTTYLEARANVRFQRKRGKPYQYRNALKELYSLVCYVLNMCGGAVACELHELLISHFKPMGIVTFNYDLIADQTLAKLDLLPKYERTYTRGKTIQIASSAGKISSRPLKRPRKRNEFIPLFKLHGSIHWNKLGRKQGYQISGIRKYPAIELEYVAPPKSPFIIPPVAAKTDVTNSALHDLWIEARKKLSGSSTWIIWGYSFPQTDTITTVLLKNACQGSRGKKKNVFIINPDAGVEKRIKKALANVNIQTWHSIERFLYDYDLLKSTPNSKKTS